MRLITKLRRAPARSTALALHVGASAPSSAGRVSGVLILPVPVEWSRRVLPAGGYVFVVSSAMSRSRVDVRGIGEDGVFFAAASEPAPGVMRSEIGLRYDGRYHVRSLTLREAGTTLFFDVRRPQPAGPGAKRWPGLLAVFLRPFLSGRAERRVHHEPLPVVSIEPRVAASLAEAPISTSDSWRPS